MVRTMRFKQFAQRTSRSILKEAFVVDFRVFEDVFGISAGITNRRVFRVVPNFRDALRKFRCAKGIGFAGMTYFEHIQARTTENN